MSAGKIIGYIFSGILIFFGILFLWSAFSPNAPLSRLFTAAVLIGIGVVIIIAIKMREPKPKQEIAITQKVDLTGDVEVAKLKCKNCGAQLDKNSIAVAEGAVVVNCPFCGTTYQIVEEPKW